MELVQAQEMPVSAAPGTWAANLCVGNNQRLTTLDALNKVLREYGAFNAPREGDESLATKPPNQKKVAMAMLLTMLWQELENDKIDDEHAVPLWPMGKAPPSTR